MSIVLAESVAISKSKLAKGFNGDSLNLDGKIVSVDGADKGFKAAGNVKPPYCAVVGSSNRKGFANGAVTAFNDYSKNICEKIEDSYAQFDTYFDDMSAVIEKCEIEGSQLSIGAIAVSDSCVAAAKKGNVHILRFSDGDLFEIAISEQDGGKGYQLISSVNNGDIFAVVSEEAAENLDYDGIINVFDSGNDLKSMASDFIRLLPVDSGKDCTVVLIKLKVKDIPVAPTVAPVSDDLNVDFSAAEKTTDTADVAVNDDMLEDYQTHSINKLGKKKLLGLIPIIALVVVLAVVVGYYVATKMDIGGNENPSGNTDIPVFDDGTDTETTTENTSENVVDPETTTVEEETTSAEEETTTPVEDDTTRAPETTTRAPETTTRAPETTTRAPETTTRAPETTTRAPETTTRAPETTTRAPETTTERPTQTPPDWWDVDLPYYGM